MSATNKKTEENDDTGSKFPTVVSHDHGIYFNGEEEFKIICWDCGMKDGVFEHANNVDILDDGIRIILTHTNTFFINDQNVPFCDQMFEELSFTLLHFAVTKTVERLLTRILKENIVDIDIRNSSGHTPLIVACQIFSKSPEIVKILVEHGATPEACDFINNTPLHYAVGLIVGNLEIVQYLIHSGANVNARNKIGRTVLHEAVVRQFNDQIVEYLVSTGKCELETVDNSGCTPLMSAIMNPDPNIKNIKILIDNGAKIIFSNENIRSPLHVTFEKNLTLMLDHWTHTEDYILSKVSKEKGMTEEELIIWMTKPPFCLVKDVYGRNWVFNAFKKSQFSQGYSKKLVDILLNLEEIEFETTGPFGIRLDAVIRRHMKKHAVYWENVNKFEEFFAKLKNKSRRVTDCKRKPVASDLRCMFEQLSTAVKRGPWDTQMLWDLITEISSPLVIDWLRPAVGISHTRIKQQFSTPSISPHSPHLTAVLAQDVQLAMEPHNTYKNLIQMRNGKGQTLLHDAAECGNGIAVHLLLMFGSKNLPDNENQLPYQIAFNSRNEELADFILQFYRISENKISLSDDAQNDFHDCIWEIIGEFTHNEDMFDLQIYAQGIPEIQHVLDKIKELKKQNQQKNNRNSQTTTNDNSKLLLSETDQRNFDHFQLEQQLQELTHTELNNKFGLCSQVFTDGSSFPNRKGTGAAYYDESENSGVGIPLGTSTDIHGAELAAIKLALEEVACEKDSVVLTDRQPILEVLNMLYLDLQLSNSFMRINGLSRISVLFNWIILFRMAFPPNPDIKYSLHWIPAHEGLEGNDVADLLAKKAAKERRVVLSKEVESDIQMKRSKKTKLKQILEQKRNERKTKK